MSWSYGHEIPKKLLSEIAEHLAVSLSLVPASRDAGLAS
jgi:hypothetical protein